MTSSSESELRVHGPEELSALPTSSRIIVRCDSHAGGVVDLLHGEGAGRNQLDLVKSALARNRDGELEAVVEIPMTTLSAPHLEDQLSALASWGAHEIRLVACPAEAPYGWRHQVDVCFSVPWLARKRASAATKAEELDLVYHDLLP